MTCATLSERKAPGIVAGHRIVATLSLTDSSENPLMILMMTRIWMRRPVAEEGK
jgi:hypothetical protein